VQSRRLVVVVEAVVVSQMQMCDSRRQIIDILPESVVLVEIGITCVETVVKRLKPPCDFLYRREFARFETKFDIVQFGEFHDFGGKAASVGLNAVGNTEGSQTCYNMGAEELGALDLLIPLLDCRLVGARSKP